MMYDLKPLKDLIISDPVLKIFANQASRRRIKAWLVGGYVRDALLGKDPKDADLMLDGEGSAELMGKLVAEKFGSTLVRFEKRIVVYRITINKKQYDFSDLNETTIELDLKLRDFTVNSLAIDIAELVQCPNPKMEMIVDASTSLDDLQKKVLRINSTEVLKDDPLRVIRLFRFQKQLGFTIEPDTFKAVSENYDKLPEISGERIRDELFQILCRKGASETLQNMDNVGILTTLFPYLAKMKNVDQNDYHHLNVFDHTLEAIRQVEHVLELDSLPVVDFKDHLKGYLTKELVPGRPRYALMKLALLFHDIAKPQTRDIREDGRITFIGHNNLALEFIEPYLEYLKLSKQERLYVNTLVENHLHPGFLDPDHPTLPKSIFRYYDRNGEMGVDIVLISIADRLAAQGPKVTDEINERHDRIATILLDAFFNKNKILIRPPVIVTGKDIIKELGLPESREVGILLKVIREGQVSGEVRTYDDAITMAKRFREEVKDSGRQESRVLMLLLQRNLDY